MAEGTFARGRGEPRAGRRRETGIPRPATAPGGRSSPRTPELSRGCQRASRREAGGSQGASNPPPLGRSARGSLPTPGRGRGGCGEPHGGAGRLCPANAARERSRVRTLRQAFLALQAALPTVPPDTKLSKLDVLVLATSYIAHLSHTLHPGQAPARGPRFLHPMKKWPMRARLYAGAWAADAADAPVTPSRGTWRGREGSSPGAGGTAV
ncbi:transcription factor 23 [Pelodiscus sinensis]|uniref:transcription factor 23 n=1 Tax=Pelodiscus sinensis TaxID=13735 RepID=UPI003F6C1F33